MSRKEGIWGKTEMYNFLYEKAHNKLIDNRNKQIEDNDDLESLFHLDIKYQELSRLLNECDKSIKLIRFMRYYLGVKCVCPLGYVISACEECN